MTAEKKSSNRIILGLLAALMIGYAAFFSAQLLLHHYTFGTRAMDVASMDQTAWNTLHGRWFAQTNNPAVINRLGLHVEPIFVPVSWLYLLYSGPETLFIFEALVVALGAIPVFALARLKLKNDGLALVFAAIFLLFPAIQGATMMEFHPITLVPTLLLAAFYCLETRRTGWYALFLALALACKEDVGLLALMIGLYALIINRQTKTGWFTILLSLAWTYLAVFVIPPHFAATQNVHWDRYGHLGASAADIVLNLFRRPDLFIAQLQAADALTYVRLLLTPSAFLALLNPVTLLLGLPSLGINLLSNFTPMHEANRLIYAAPLVPAVLISSIYGAARLQGWLTQKARLSAGLVNGGLAIVLLAASLGYQYQYGFLPGGGQFRGWETVTPHHRRAQVIFEQIPATAAVSAQDKLVPHLSQRQKIYIFDRVADADYLVFDLSDDSWPLHPLELQQRLDGFLSGGFGVVDGLDGYLLLKRGLNNSVLPDKLFDFARVTDPASFEPQFSAPVEFDGKIRLLGYAIGPDAHAQGQVVITLYWQALEPLSADYVLYPFVLDRQGNVVETVTEHPLVATLWYPTSRWQPGEIIATRTLPRAFDGPVTLAVGVTRGDWTNREQRLKISAAPADLYTAEQQTWVRLALFEQTDRRTVAVASPPAQTVTPAQPRTAVFGEAIRLLGVNPPPAKAAPGRTIQFSLYWQTDRALPLDWTCFAHLLNEQGEAVAQLDWQPQDAWGRLPTSAWQANRPVADTQSLALPANLPAGTYRLIAGWYNSGDGRRLPVTTGDENAPAGGDTLLVGMIEIK